jgi:hypothetical protein
MKSGRIVTSGVPDEIFADRVFLLENNLA